MLRHLDLARIHNESLRNSKVYNIYQEYSRYAEQAVLGSHVVALVCAATGVFGAEYRHIAPVAVSLVARLFGTRTIPRVFSYLCTLTLPVLLPLACALPAWLDLGTWLAQLAVVAHV